MEEEGAKVEAFEESNREDVDVSNVDDVEEDKDRGID